MLLQRKFFKVLSAISTIQYSSLILLFPLEYRIGKVDGWILFFHKRNEVQTSSEGSSTFRLSSVCLSNTQNAISNKKQLSAIKIWKKNRTHIKNKKPAFWNYRKNWMQWKYLLSKLNTQNFFFNARWKVGGECRAWGASISILYRYIYILLTKIICLFLDYPITICLLVTFIRC